MTRFKKKELQLTQRKILTWRRFFRAGYCADAWLPGVGWYYLAHAYPSGIRVRFPGIRVRFHPVEFGRGSVSQALHRPLIHTHAPIFTDLQSAAWAAEDHVMKTYPLAMLRGLKRKNPPGKTRRV